MIKMMERISASSLPWGDLTRKVFFFEGERKARLADGSSYEGVFLRNLVVALR